MRNWRDAWSRRRAIHCSAVSTCRRWPSAAAAGVPVVVDDTVAGVGNIDVTPWADLVFCSLTKLITGSGMVMGGAVICPPDSPQVGRLRAVLDEEFESDGLVAGCAAAGRAEPWLPGALRPDQPNRNRAGRSTGCASGGCIGCGIRVGSIPLPLIGSADRRGATAACCRLNWSSRNALPSDFYDAWRSPRARASAPPIRWPVRSPSWPTMVSWTGPSPVGCRAGWCGCRSVCEDVEELWQRLRPP